VVTAMCLAMLSPDAVGEIFNLGHPQALGLFDIANLTVAAAGGASDVSLIPWPPEHAQIDIGSFQGDFSKAKRVLGWEPEVSFAHGIATTMDFYRNHHWYLPDRRDHPR
jgi:nucleoside-diphosphate-sugar epimerase